MLATIGYEKSTLDELITALKAAKIERLIDVRAVAASRRAGFSKTLLSTSLQAADIDYQHLRALGTPKAGREAARKGRTDEMRAIFAVQMATPEAQDALAKAEMLAREMPSALLCFCGEAEKCHRRMVSDALAIVMGVQVVDL